MKRRIVSGLKLLFTPLAFAFLIYFAWQSRDQLATLLVNASWLHLGLAAMLWAALHAVSPLLAVIVIGGCGSKVSWLQAFTTHVARLPARYLPGGIWHTVGRVMDYREQGVAARHLSAFVVLENGLAAAMTLAAGGAIVFSTRGADSIGFIAATASIAGLVALPLLAWFVNARVLQPPDRMPFSAFAKSAATTAIFWFGATVAFLFYLHAFPESTGIYTSLEMSGIYLFSWGVGFLAVFAPQGIGVFEVVASELMTSPIGFMGLAALIAGFRVVVLVADIAVWSIYQLGRRRR